MPMYCSGFILTFTGYLTQIAASRCPMSCCWVYFIPSKVVDHKRGEYDWVGSALVEMSGVVYFVIVVFGQVLD